MIDIAKEIMYHACLNESAKSKCLFKDERMTFRQLKDAFKDTFGTNVVSFSKKVPSNQIYLTMTDGNFFISSPLHPQKAFKVQNASRLCEVESSSRDAVSSTLDNVVNALKGLDQKMLNRCFANGKNRLKINIICPPAGNEKLYGDRCFVDFDGIDCFDDDGKNVGRDEKSSVELYNALKNDDTLSSAELSELPVEKLQPMSRCTRDSDVLQKLLSKLEQLVDGIGWGCSFKYYIDDACSRKIINKALQHGIDISKDGAFVNELVSRIAGSQMRPTKSDLATFAKREGVNCKSDEYKAFLDDIEQSASEICREVICPLESVLYYAVAKAAQCMMCMLALDPNPKAQKLFSHIDGSAFDAGADVDGCIPDTFDQASFKKQLEKLMQYSEIAPDEVRVVVGGKPYSAKCCCDKLEKLCSLI